MTKTVRLVCLCFLAKTLIRPLLIRIKEGILMAAADPTDLAILILEEIIDQILEADLAIIIAIIVVLNLETILTIADLVNEI